MSTSKKLIKHFQRMAKAVRSVERTTACWMVELATGVKYTEEERVELFAASRQLSDAKDKVTKIWSKRIGDAVTSEIRCGEYKP